MSWARTGALAVKKHWVGRCVRQRKQDDSFVIGNRTMCSSEETGRFVRHRKKDDVFVTRDIEFNSVCYREVVCDMCCRTSYQDKSALEAS